MSGGGLPVDATHDPSLRSWVSSANAEDGDFPLQNLPFGRFRLEGEVAWRIGVAIGDQVLDLQAAGLIDHAEMRRLLQSPLAERRALRWALSTGLRSGSPQAERWAAALRPMAGIELGLPCAIGDYTDFYVGIHHATAVGRLFRPDQALLPNYTWVPIGYHGRASTIQPSGAPVRRPWGQLKTADQAVPRLAPTQRLDFELEMGIVIGAGNAQGEPVSLAQAEAHVFGLTLFNDWSARDIQAWEYQPLGPFLSKSFASTVSPWIVTLEALAPFRRPLVRPDDHPPSLPYLHSEAVASAGAFDVSLEVLLQTEAMRARGLPPQRISQSNFADAAYWAAAQLVTHHTVNGCGLQPGDLLGTGTLSGAGPGQAGSLLELSDGGRSPLAVGLGERRAFVEDGDTVVLRGRCQRGGFRSIGFGSCEARVWPAITLA